MKTKRFYPTERGGYNAPTVRHIGIVVEQGFAVSEVSLPGAEEDIYNYEF